MIKKKADMSNHCDGRDIRSFMFTNVHQADALPVVGCAGGYSSRTSVTWRVILVSKADIFHTESLRILAKRFLLIIKAAMKFCALEVLCISWIRHQQFPEDTSRTRDFVGKPAVRTDGMGM